MSYQRSDTCNITVPYSITRLVNWKSTHREFEKQFLDDSSEDESVWTGSYSHQDSDLKCNFVKTSTRSSKRLSSKSGKDKSLESKKPSKNISSPSSSESEEVLSREPSKSPRISIERDDTLSLKLAVSPTKGKSISPRTSESDAAESQISPERQSCSPSNFEGNLSENSIKKKSCDKTQSLNLNDRTSTKSHDSTRSSLEPEEAPSATEFQNNSSHGTLYEKDPSLNLIEKLSNSKLNTSESLSEFEDDSNLSSISNTQNNELSNISLVDIICEETFHEDFRNSIFLEDFEEDDEIFILQCPKGIELSSFKDQVVSLDGESSLSLKCGKNFLRYESYAEKEDLGRIIKFVLPSHATRSFSIYTFSVAGSVLLSESMDLPEVGEKLIEPPAKIPIPEHLQSFFEETTKNQCSRKFKTIETSTLDDPDETIQKKKKKKHRKSKNKSMEESSKMECFEVENSETIPKRMKKSHKLEEIAKVKDDPDETIQKKKKKKHRKSKNKSMEESSKMVCFEVENSETIPKRMKKSHKLEEIANVKDDPDETIQKKKKKRHRKSKNKSMEESSKMECFEVENSETIPKRMKKSHKLEEIAKVKDDPDETIQKKKKKRPRKSKNKSMEESSKIECF